MLRGQIAFACAFVIGAMLSCSLNGIADAGHSPCCPDCGCKVCVPSTEIVAEKKSCWAVECKDICIPAPKWPWQDCCAPAKCAKVKTVKVLKRVDYECEKCGCKWDVMSVADDLSCTK